MEDISQIEESKLRNIVYRRLGSQFKVPNLRKYINSTSKNCGSRPCTVDEFVTKVEMIIRTSPTARRPPKEEEMGVERKPKKRQASPPPPPSEIDQLAQLFGNIGIVETAPRKKVRVTRPALKMEVDKRAPKTAHTRMQLDKREPTRRSQRHQVVLEPIVEETTRKTVRVPRKSSGVAKMQVDKEEVKPKTESPVHVKEEEPQHKLERHRTSSSSSEGRENKKISRRDESALLRSLLKMGF